MDVAEERWIAATPDAVWAGLTDPDVLKACIPGCEEMTGSPEAGYAALVVRKLGPVKVKVRGTLTLSDIVPGQGCTVVGEGSNCMMGSAQGRARLTLAPDGDGTRITFTVDAQLGGRFATFGKSVVDGFARSFANHFFDRFRDQLGA